MKLTPDDIRTQLQTPGSFLFQLAGVENIELTIGTMAQHMAIDEINKKGAVHPVLANAEIAFFGRRLTQEDSIK